jgi:hypothetical protein
MAVQEHCENIIISLQILNLFRLLTNNLCLYVRYFLQYLYQLV